MKAKLYKHPEYGVRVRVRHSGTHAPIQSSGVCYKRRRHILEFRSMTPKHYLRHVLDNKFMLRFSLDYPGSVVWHHRLSVSRLPGSKLPNFISKCYGTNLIECPESGKISGDCHPNSSVMSNIL